MTYRIMALILLAALLTPSAAWADPGVTETNCLYPSVHDRFGVTVETDIRDFAVGQLAAGAYLNWRAAADPAHPAAMAYLPMVRTYPWGQYPTRTDLEVVIRNNPGVTLLVGNEPDTIWQDNNTPQEYARAYHDIYTLAKSIDPGVRVAFAGLSTVSSLRLAWLDMVRASYQSQFGVPMPVDVWNIHPYMVNEMQNEWGNGIPPGIDNAMGSGYGAWSLVNDAGASGGTYTQSKAAGARFYFAFRGNTVTVFLRKGPDAGIAKISVDRDLNNGIVDDVVDLYSPTPGVLSRTYNNLPTRTEPTGDRHNLRVVVTGTKNAASSNTWIRVDYATAPSTASLPNGRLEDNYAMRARLVGSIDDHDNLDLIEQMIRDFRQWMLNRGQSHKPLINTEHGILMTEDLGFDYSRVRTFMLNSFNRFRSLADPTIGMPEDGGRLLQEWHWFTLDVDYFEGRRLQSNLFSRQTHQITQLGQDFGNYLRPLKTSYVDLDAYSLQTTPHWPLFAGDPALIEVDGQVRNRGDLASGPFQITLKLGSNTPLHTWDFASLPRRFQPGFIAPFHYDYVAPVVASRNLRIFIDEANQVAEPCDTNNSLLSVVAAPGGVDLALSNVRSDPLILPAVRPGTTITVPLRVDLDNLGSVGTAASQITVRLYRGDPNAGGALLTTQTLTPGSVTLPAVIAYDWPEQGPGYYQIYAVVDGVPEESNLANNTVHGVVVVPAGNAWLPLIKDHRWNNNFRVPDAPLPQPLDNKLPTVEQVSDP